MYNPEMMQMNMLMNSLGSMQGGNNNDMNMLPLMMMYQNQNGNQKIDLPAYANYSTEQHDARNEYDVKYRE